MINEKLPSEQPTMSKAEATQLLMAELEKGRRSGEEKGWLTLEEVISHFEEKSRNAKIK